MNQSSCPCYYGSHPCYWSSKGTALGTSEEYILYKLAPTVGIPMVLAGFEMTVYRAHWHTGAPTYGPKRAKIEFEQPTSDDERVGSLSSPSKLDWKSDYVSQEYEVKNEEGPQVFTFEKAIVLTGPVRVRVTFIGKHQRQLIGYPQDYYLCVSHVGVIEHPLWAASTSTQFSVGDVVEIFGLTSAAGQLLNGKMGDVRAVNPEDERINVTLHESGETKRLKRINIKRKEPSNEGEGGVDEGFAAKACTIE